MYCSWTVARSSPPLEPDLRISSNSMRTLEKWRSGPVSNATLAAVQVNHMDSTSIGMPRAASVGAELNLRCSGRGWHHTEMVSLTR